MVSLKERPLTHMRQEEEMKSIGIVLLSGGIDSAVTAWLARKECKELHALTFLYGQAHSKETDYAISLGVELGSEGHLGLEGHKIMVLPLNQIGGSSLFNAEEVPTEGLQEEIPSTWVPQRNAIFLAITFGWAEVIGADRVYSGLNIVDYSGYPDCRPEFVEALQKALNLASKQYVEAGKEIKLLTPLSYKSKTEIVKLGLELGVPFEHTWSCYKGGVRACGVCDSCRIRLKAFKEVGMDDPLVYER